MGDGGRRDRGSGGAAADGGDTAPPGVDGPRNGEFGDWHRRLGPGVVPPAGAGIDALLDFGLTFDGYEYWGSAAACGELANGARSRWDRRGELPGDLAELRTCLFFEQRRYHHFATDPDPDSERYIRELVEAVRAFAGDPATTGTAAARGASAGRGPLAALLDERGIDPAAFAGAVPWPVSPAASAIRAESAPRPGAWGGPDPGGDGDPAQQAVVGEPPLVVLDFRADGGVEVAEYLVVWDGPAYPEPLRADAGVAVLPAEPGADPAVRARELAGLVSAAAGRRLARFRTCRSCGRHTPPEHLHDDELCQGCAQRDLGVVY